MRWSRDTTTQTIRAIHPVVLCKVQILAPPPNLKGKTNVVQIFNNIPTFDQLLLAVQKRVSECVCLS